MSFNLGKVFTVIAHDVTVGAKAVEHFLIGAGQKLAIVDARVPQILTLSHRLLGDALKAAIDGGDAAAQKGLNIAIDAQVVADLQQLAKDFKDELAAFGVKL